MEYLIKTYTNPGETVLDFTMGSGTTGVACLNTGRKFIGIELDPEYFRIAKERINNHKAKTGWRKIWLVFQERGWLLLCWKFNQWVSHIQRNK